MTIIRSGGRAAALLLLAALAAPALAEGPSPAPAPAPATTPAPLPPILSDFDRFHPVFARNGMVVAQEEIAAAVGRDVLKAGGNAVDAAVATGFALAVTLPRAGNLGGGGFLVVHLKAKGLTRALDFRETAPAATTPDVFLNDKGEADPQKSRFSGLAVGVPGSVAGLAAAHAAWGSGRFTLAELIRPAIALARDGFPASEDLSRSLAQSRERMSRDAETARVFFPGGAAPAPGERFVQPDLARSLEAIAQRGPDAFYAGTIAERIAATVKAKGGRMTAADLAAYRVVERDPIEGRYRGRRIVSMPPPSSGGLHVAQILAMLETRDLKAMGAGSADAVHFMAEAMRRAYADRSEYLGDPAFVKVPVKALLSRAYAGTRAAEIDMTRATPSASVKPGDLAPHESDQTTHYSVVDAAGDAVAVTTTLNFSYGVGFVAEGTGILLNNELDDFAAAPGAANAFGLVGGAANAPGPAKRPLSSMSPTLVFEGDRLVLVTGSPGGSRIISTVVQLIVGMIDHGMNVAEATAAPRMHHQWRPDVLTLEPGFSPDTIRLLEARGHKVEVRATSGSTQSIAVTADGRLAGAADPRRPGAGVAGY